jgi:hypothetical protein
VDGWSDRLPNPLTLVRVVLVVFVLAWLFGPYGLRSAVPIWLVFLVALGLEVQFFVSGLRSAPVRDHDRGPQEVDRERYGFEGETDDLLLVRVGDEELWIPYSGESDEELDELIARERMRLEEEAAAPALPVARSWGPPLRRFAVGLGVIGALVLVLWFVESRTGWDALDGDTQAEAAARFSEEASRIAGKTVRIHCDESGDYVGAVQHADGVAEVGGEFAFLTPQRCYDLYRLAFEDEVRAGQTARAIAVLAHEAWHLRGVGDEGMTECYALQSGVEIGRRLGLSESRARQMMRQQLVENRLRIRGSPEYLVPPDCRDGSRLDLDPAESRFP